MIFFAYACLIVAVTKYLRGSIDPIPPRFESPARVLGVVAGAGFAATGFLLLGNDEATFLGTTSLVLLAAGGIVYASGVARWRGPAAVGLRLAGWFLVVAALAIPSTLTLLLPLASLLVLTLRPTPGPDRVARIASA